MASQACSGDDELAFVMSRWPRNQDFLEGGVFGVAVTSVDFDLHTLGAGFK